MMFMGNKVRFYGDEGSLLSELWVCLSYCESRSSYSTRDTPMDMVVISVESLSIYSQIDLIIKLASFIHSIIIH